MSLTNEQRQAIKAAISARSRAYVAAENACLQELGIEVEVLGDFECHRCRKFLSADAFGPSQRRSGGECRACNTARLRESRAANPEKWRVHNKRYRTRRAEREKGVTVALQLPLPAAMKRNGIRWTRPGLVTAIRDFAASAGRPPTADEWRVAGPWPTLKTVMRHFGSWAAAIEAAGFQRPTRGTYVVSSRSQPRGPYRKKG